MKRNCISDIKDYGRSSQLRRCNSCVVEARPLAAPSNESTVRTTDIDTETPDKITRINMMNIRYDMFVINTQIGRLGVKLFRAQRKKCDVTSRVRLLRNKLMRSP